MLSTVVAVALGIIGQNWSTFAPEGMNFKVDLPGVPSRATSRTVTTAAGRSQLTSAQVPTVHAVYSVQVTENRSPVDPQTLDEGIRRFAENRSAKLGSVRPISLGKNPGRDFEMTEGLSFGTIRHRMRWVASGNFLFMLSVAGMPGASIPADADRFLGSLEIGGARSPIKSHVGASMAAGGGGPMPRKAANEQKIAASTTRKPATQEANSEESPADVDVDDADSSGDAAGKPVTKKPALTRRRITLSSPPRNARRYADDQLADLQRSFPNTARDGFRDVGPTGSVLVGVRVSYIERFGGPKVRSVQPIYRSAGNRHYVGRIHGQVVGPVTMVVARPGYAIGGLVTHTGLTVDGFGIVFMKVDGDRLNPGDTYNSQWIGDVKGGSPGQVMSDGTMIVGLQGRSGNEVFALGLIGLK